jgi:hypothetical protein
LPARHDTFAREGRRGKNYMLCAYRLRVSAANILNRFLKTPHPPKRRKNGGGPKIFMIIRNKMMNREIKTGGGLDFYGAS